MSVPVENDASCRSVSVALDPIQQSLVLLASAVNEARNTLAEPGLSEKSKLAKLRRILGNELIEIIVQGAEAAMNQIIDPQDTDPDRLLGPCPVCNGAKTIAGATCFRCRGSGEVQRLNAG
jgi:hypothetical protein